ncbi:MAG: hypothetical protein ACI31G_04810 [Bacilli bacterium]
MNKICYQYDNTSHTIIFDKPIKVFNNKIIGEEIKNEVENIIFESCDKPINVIEGLSFNCYPKLKKVEFNRDIDFINANAFLFNPLLENVLFCGNVAFINHEAFYGCLSLKKVTINYHTIRFKDSFDEITSVSKKYDNDIYFEDNPFIKNNVAYTSSDFYLTCGKIKNFNRFYLIHVLKLTQKGKRKKYLITPANDLRIPTSKEKLICYDSSYYLTKDSFKSFNLFNKKKCFYLSSKCAVKTFDAFNKKSFSCVYISHKAFESYYIKNDVLNYSPLVIFKYNYTNRNRYPYEISIPEEEKGQYELIGEKYFKYFVSKGKVETDYLLMSAYLGCYDAKEFLIDQEYYERNYVKNTFPKSTYEKKVDSFNGEDLKNYYLEKLNKQSGLFIDYEVIKKWFINDKNYIQHLEELKPDDIVLDLSLYLFENNCYAMKAPYFNEYEKLLFALELYNVSNKYFNLSYKEKFTIYLKKNKQLKKFIIDISSNQYLYDKYDSIIKSLPRVFSVANNDDKEVKALLYKTNANNLFSEIQSKCSDELDITYYYETNLDKKTDKDTLFNYYYAYVLHISPLHLTDEDSLNYITRALTHMGYLIKEKINNNELYAKMYFENITDILFETDYKDICYILTTFVDENYIKESKKQIEIKEENKQKLTEIFNKWMVLTIKRLNNGQISEDEILLYGSKEEKAPILLKREQNKRQKEMEEQKRKQDELEIARLKEEQKILNDYINAELTAVREDKKRRDAIEAERKRKEEEERKKQEALLEEKRQKEVERKRREEAEKARLKKEEEERKLAAVSNTSSSSSSRTTSSISNKTTSSSQRTLESYFNDVVCPYPKEVIKNDDKESIDILGDFKCAEDRKFLWNVYWDYWKEADYRNAFTCLKYLKSNKRLGIHYYYGLGVKKDIKKAFKHLEDYYFDTKSSEYVNSQTFDKDFLEIEKILLKINSISPLAYRAKVNKNYINFYNFIHDSSTELANIYTDMYSPSYDFKYFSVDVRFELPRSYAFDLYGNKFIPYAIVHFYPSKYSKDHWTSIRLTNSASNALKQTMNSAAWNASYLDDEYKTSSDYKDAVDTINIRKNRADEIDRYSSSEIVANDFKYYGIQYFKEKFANIEKDTYFAMRPYDLSKHGIMYFDKKYLKEDDSYKMIPIRNIDIRFHYKFNH